MLKNREVQNKFHKQPISKNQKIAFSNNIPIHTLKHCAKIKYNNASINELLIVAMLRTFELYYSKVYGEQLKVYL